MGLIYLTYLLGDLNRTQFKNNAVASWKKVINNYNGSHGQEYFSLPVPAPEPSLPSHHLFPTSAIPSPDSGCPFSLVYVTQGVQFSSVQLLSCVQLFATPWTTALQPSLSITNSQSLLKPMSIVSVMPSNHLILCCPLLLLPSIFPSIRVFSNESALHIMWPKYWSFSFSISPSNEYSGLISFKMDWFDLLAVQGTLKSFLQHHSSKASILWHSAFFIVQLSHPYITTGKTIALTRRIFVGKVMFLLFNMLARLVTTFLPRTQGVGDDFFCLFFVF